MIFTNKQLKKGKKSSRPLLTYRAERALKEAVAEVIAEHRRNGIPIVIWRDGKVVLVPFDQIGVSDSAQVF